MPGLLFLRAAAVPLLVLLQSLGMAHAEEKEPSAVVAIGPEGEWTFPGGTTSLVPGITVG
jgi:hypothetical protein